jgi:hypothetical protein
MDFKLFGSFKFYQPDDQRQNGGEPEHVSKKMMARRIQQRRTAGGAVSVTAGPLCAAPMASQVFHFRMKIYSDRWRFLIES